MSLKGFRSFVLSAVLAAGIFASASQAAPMALQTENYRLNCRDSATDELMVVRVYHTNASRSIAPATLSWYKLKNLRAPHWALQTKANGTIETLPEHHKIDASGRPVPPLAGYFTTSTGNASFHAAFEPLVARLKWSGCFSGKTYEAKVEGRVLSCDWTTPPCQATTPIVTNTSVLVSQYDLNRYDVNGASFALNEKTNLPYVAVQYADREVCRDVRSNNNCYPVSVGHYNVAGLVLVGKDLVYTGNGKSTVCAKLSWKKFMWHLDPVFTNTGACALRIVDGQNNDGFFVKQVFFQVRN